MRAIAVLGRQLHYIDQEGCRNARRRISGVRPGVSIGPLEASVLVPDDRVTTMNTIANRNALSRHVALLALLPSFALVVALGNATVCAQGTQLYRWVDEQGNVNYTDKIPASQAEKGHVELSEDGMRVRTVPPAKTAEEIQRERELERLRAQQQRLIDQQKAEDRVLLRTFRNTDDLIMVRDGKLSALDVMIQVTKGNVRRQQDWLTHLRTEAAELERAGEPVTEQLQDRIAAAERSLNQAMGTILERERQKQEIRETFARDLKRFQQLKDIPEEAPREEQSQQPSELANLIECRDKAECERHVATGTELSAATCNRAHRNSGRRRGNDPAPALHQGHRTHGIAHLEPESQQRRDLPRRAMPQLQRDRRCPAAPSRGGMS